ncbi:MAG: hypothetical protein KBA26_06545 [Candidatus Delongbacteria bacterium]|nr:hypothetical protein [Candidatus Delongbacteria bacterium]
MRISSSDYGINQYFNSPISKTSQGEAKTSEEKIYTTVKSSDRVQLGIQSQLTTEALFGIAPKNNRAITLDDLRTEGMRVLEDVRQGLVDYMVRSGIDTDRPFELETDGQGNVVVVSDHPDKIKIEEWFEDHPEQANQFRKGSSMMELVRAGEEYLWFSRAYAIDPEKAVADYAELFNSHESAVILFSGDSTGVRFRREWNG